MQQRERRLTWVDMVKAVCMLGVYLMHSEAYYPTEGVSYGYVLSPFYVNAFFVVSGYLMFRTLMRDGGSVSPGATCGRSFGNVLFRLLIPTILFSSLIYIPKLLFHGERLGFSRFCLEVFGGVSYWFTSALVVAQVVLLSLFLLIRSRNTWVYLVCSVALFALGLYVNGLHERTQALDYFPWYYATGLEYTLLMSLGGLYGRYEAMLERILRSWGSVLLALVYASLLVCGMAGEPLLILGLGGRVNLPGSLAVLCGVLLLIRLCKLLPYSGWMAYMGRHSIVFYFFSGVMPAMVGKLMSIAVPAGPYACTLCVCVCSLLLSALVSLLLNRYAPFMLDWRTIRAPRAGR